MTFIRSLFCAAIASAFFCTAGSAKETALNYLPANQPAVATLLAPPPPIDSPEQAADMETVRAVYHAASEADKQAAHAEKKFSVFNFTDSVGAFFIATNLPKTTAFFEKVQLDAETVTDLGKVFFQRPRPYTTDTNLVNGKLEKSFSYPSGHSTEATTIALVLADLLPEKHAAILAHADLMGWHRVQIARHYPSDIYAGRTLARVIVQELKKSEVFQKDFAEVKAELTAAQSVVK